MQSYTLTSLLPNIRRFEWRFAVDYYNPASISCIALSAEDARQQILSILEQIENLADEKKAYEEKCAATTGPDTWEKLTQLRKEFMDKLPPIEAKTGCYCSTVEEYSRAMVIKRWSDHAEITLGEYISSTEPTSSEIRTVTFFSCLDG